MTERPTLDDFPLHISIPVRYSDTDRQGHVNNAVFATYLEVARVAFFHDPAFPLNEPGTSFVLAHLSIDYRNEILWPNTVQVGTGVLSVGRSSMRLRQYIFVAGTLAATAETVCVQTNDATRSSQPISDAARERLATVTLPA